MLFKIGSTKDSDNKAASMRVEALVIIVKLNVLAKIKSFLFILVLMMANSLVTIFHISFLHLLPILVLEADNNYLPILNVNMSYVIR